MKPRNNFQKYVLAEKKASKKTVTKRLLMALGLGGVLAVSGCGRTITGVGKSALIMAKAVTLDVGDAMVATGQHIGSVQDVPSGQPDSMELDHAPTISIEQARQIAKEYNINIE